MEKQPKHKVIVSVRARQMLGEHVRFMAQVSPSAARKAKSSILATIRSLDKFPERYGFLVDEYIPPNKYHKCFVESYYLVLYQIKDEAVYVDYIVDCRQDYGWLIR